MKFDKSYRDVLCFKNFGDRLAILSLHSFVYVPPSKGIGYDFYKHCKQWHQLREEIIKRDMACDLGVNGMFIKGPIIVHHIDPLVESDFVEWNEDKLFNPNNLICCSVSTHNEIHYGKKKDVTIIERRPGDTKLW